MIKTIKMLSSILLLIGMISFGNIPIFANETGSITIILEDSNNELPKENVEFGLTKVADIIDGEYVSLEEYSSFDFNNIQNANEMKDTATRLNRLISSNDAIGSTDKNGILKFEGLEIGVYLLHPTYIADYEIIEPTLVSIPNWDEISYKMEYEVIVYPKHEPLPVIRINKVDSKTDEPITNKDFEFTLYTDASCKDMLEILNEENNDGIIDFDITYGTYYLKETKAPDGYRLSDEIVKIEFNDFGVFFNNQPVEKTEGRYIFDFENDLISTKTPNTGDDSSIILWQSLAALMILIPAVLLLINEKDELDE